MTRRPALSKGEMEVARVVWQLGQATVRQAHEAIPKTRNMDFATVQTYLRRLEAKGYVVSSLAGHARVYAPKVLPTMVIRETVGDLIDRLFGGDALPLVQHLIEDRGVTAAEISQLRQLLDRLEGEQPLAERWNTRHPKRSEGSPPGAQSDQDPSLRSG